MKKSTLISIIAILVFLATACGRKPSVSADETTGKFTFSTWGAASFYEDCFGRMQQANPDYSKLTFENMQADSEDTLYTRLKTDFAAKSYESTPDMVEMSAYRIGEFAEAGLLVDVTEQMTPYKDKISPAVWQGISHKDHIYAIPWMTNSAMVWYREDVFKMAGVDASAIKTWDDFIAAGKVITNFNYPDGKKRYMVSIGTEEPAFMNMQLMLGQLNTSIFDANTGDVTIDKDPNFHKAFDVNTRFVQESIALEIQEWEAPWYAALGDGTLATFISANWFSQMIKDGTLGENQEGVWRAMALPAFEAGGNTASLESGSANVVIINKPGVKQNAAWAMAQTCFLNDKVTPDLYKKHILVPAYLPALGDPAFTEADPFYGGEKIGVLDKSIQEKALMPAFPPAYNEAMSLITAQLALAMNGEKTVDQAIVDAANDIRNNIGTSK
jgi:ABC-type glycerol-3-phosphate transport system substrate-binding protein